MKFQERTITLKDGRTCVLRPATPDDAPEMLVWLKKTAEETEFLLRYPDEEKITLEEEVEILRKKYEDPYAIFMLAVVDGKIAGNCGVAGIGYKRKFRHRCSMGIALYKEFWGLGIGTALIEYQTELAKQIGWRQLELEVVADNVRARALYKKSGFVETGRHPDAMLFDDGTFHDEILMYKLLNE